MVKSFWALLPVVAILMFASCSSNDDVFETTPVQEGVKMKHFTATATCDDETRATVQANQKTLYFQAGDRLLVMLGDVKQGELTLKSGADSSAGVFEGDMPEDIVGKQVKFIMVGEEQLGINKTTGAITYPSTFLSSSDEAVRKYSYLTGTGSFNAQGGVNFTLTQQTAFMTFNIRFKDGRTNPGDVVEVSISNGGTTVASGTVTAYASGERMLATLTIVMPAGTKVDDMKLTVKGEPISLDKNLPTTNLQAIIYTLNKVAGHKSVPLWPDGPEFSEEDLPDFYQWGDPTRYTDDSLATHYFAYRGEEYLINILVNHSYDGDKNSPGDYKWQGKDEEEAMNRRLIKYCQTGKWLYWSGTGSPDNKTVLDSEDDAATVNWGPEWRMPTVEEMRKLIEETTQSLVTIDGKRYCRFTSKTWPENYIDFPFNGYLRYLNGSNEHFYDTQNSLYLTASLHDAEPIFAWNLWIQTDGTTVTVNAGATGTSDITGSGDLARASRASGRPVRPVRVSSPSSMDQPQEP